VKYVLDTDIISELARQQPDFNVICWIQDHAEDVVLTAVSLEEIYYGILIMPDGKRKSRIKNAVDAIVQDCVDRILVFDAFCGYLCADVHAQAKRSGHTGTIEDFMIASICLRHNAKLVTRNVKDFDYINGLEAIDPFSYESPVLAELKRR
jgi:predicted nucleic acid-binding protein